MTTSFATLGRRRRLALRCLPLAALLMAGPLRAWDYEGHRTVNLIALAALPTNFPAFALEPAARERITFLGGEADRWRNTPDLALRHANGPDHYIDLEELADFGLTPAALPVFRYDFIGRLALARATHPERFAPIDPAKNEDRTREIPGLLPWAIAEHYARLRSAFSYLRALEADGAADEVANARANAVYVMGVLSHFAGDAAQPLHTTIHHHGWVGANPKGYTTNSAFHRWIDGDYFSRTGGLDAQRLARRARPARVLEDAGKGQELFRAAVEFIVAQQRQVEPLYTLERDGKLSAEGERGNEGRDFLDAQLVKGGEFLADLWLTAWKSAPEDTFLKGQLAKRKARVGQ